MFGQQLDDLAQILQTTPAQDDIALPRIIQIEDMTKSNGIYTVVYNACLPTAEDIQKGNYWFEKNPENALMKNRKEIKNIIKSDNNVIAIFSGHQHWTKQLKEDGKNYYVVGSLTDNVDMKGIPDGIYLEIELENKNVKLIEKHIKVKVDN